MSQVMCALLLAVTVAGCVRPGDRPLSLRCEWAEDDSRSLDLQNGADRDHLRYDAVAAEDMAIRWADKYAGPRSGHFEGFPEYGRQRDRCMQTLFYGIASHHGVDVALVRQYRMRRDVMPDAAAILGFGILYAVAAYGLIGLIRRRVPPDERFAFLVATTTASVFASSAGVMLGEVWSAAIESLRLGTGHLSYRADRIPWKQHRAELFACGLVLFWLAAAVRSRLGIRDNGGLASRGSQRAD